MEIKEIDPFEEKSNLLRYLDLLRSSKVLIIGDIILDQYIWGKVSRISPEAPVPVVEERGSTERLGGAGNVLNNITSVGGDAVICAVVGEDGKGKRIKEILKEMGVPLDGLIVCRDRPTTVKTRIIAHNQQVVRLDREKTDIIDDNIQKRILDLASSMAYQIDGILISDYGKGVICQNIVEGLKSIAKKSGIPICVDPKVKNFNLYSEVTLITPNHHEAGQFYGIHIDNNSSLLEAGRGIIEGLSCENLLITQGKYGMTLFERDGGIYHIPASAKDVYDVTGAGDTVIAVITLALSSGISLRSAAIMANFAAGVVVGELGTYAVKREDLEGIFKGRR